MASFVHWPRWALREARVTDCLQRGQHDLDSDSEVISVSKVFLAASHCCAISDPDEDSPVSCNWSREVDEFCVRSRGGVCGEEVHQLVKLGSGDTSTGERVWSAWCKDFFWRIGINGGGCLNCGTGPSDASVLFCCILSIGINAGSSNGMHCSRFWLPLATALCQRECTVVFLEGIVRRAWHITLNDVQDRCFSRGQWCLCFSVTSMEPTLPRSIRSWRTESLQGLGEPCFSPRVPSIFDDGGLSRSTLFTLRHWSFPIWYWRRNFTLNRFWSLLPKFWWITYMLLSSSPWSALLVSAIQHQLSMFTWTLPTTYVLRSEFIRALVSSLNETRVSNFTPQPSIHRLTLQSPRSSFLPMAQLSLSLTLLSVPHVRLRPSWSSAAIYMYWVRLKGSYMVASIFFLLLLRGWKDLIGGFDYGMDPA